MKKNIFFFLRLLPQSLRLRPPAFYPPPPAAIQSFGLTPPPCSPRSRQPLFFARISTVSFLSFLKSILAASRSSRGLLSPRALAGCTRRRPRRSRRCLVRLKLKP
ncbi:hypothetical protein LINPERPRIM_LOCUS2938 [Linum perenne]